MTLIRMEPKAKLTIAGSDLNRLMGMVQAVQNAFSVTVVHTPHPIQELAAADEDNVGCAVVELSSHDSALDVRELLDRSPGVRFVFVAQSLPLRHAVARVIRERGHAVVSNDDPPFVIAATATALLAETEARHE